jgi:UDP-glucuronate 4-epimerase
VRASARVRRSRGHCVLVTGAAGFVGCHAAAAFRRRGDGVLGLDNFNDYYDTALKRGRAALLARSGVYVVDGDIADAELLAKLFDVVPFTHVLHLAAQAGVRHALVDPMSYVRANVAGLVALLEAARAANPQPAIVWASSSSVYGLNSHVPFSEHDRDRSCLQPHLWSVTHRPQILHCLWAMGASGHGLLLLHQGHPCWSANYGL